MGVKDLIYLGIIIAATFIGGFFVGRKTVDTKTKIEYIKMEPIEGSISNEKLVPYKEEIPVNPVLPMRIDTVYQIMMVDTAAIIEDYIAKRYYNITAFDNQFGKLSLLPTLQYNKLADINWEFTPIQLRTTVYKQPVWTPFVSTSYSTFGYLGIGAGVFYRNFGLEYQYQKQFNNNLLNNPSGNLFSVKYKF